MKTLLFTLLFSVSIFATTTHTISNPEKGIAGLDIYTYKTKKLGKHIYVVSNYYVEKTVEVLNAKGEVVLKKTTVGTPIQIDTIEPGIYKIKITEGTKTDVLEYEVE
ncbi:hypothetical protein [Flavobacterium sp.]|uniref:hypothetical protein n=1 Tax=Flavobacterium sp. TaxID=239 RepID=UPI003D0A7A79